MNKHIITNKTQTKYNKMLIVESGSRYKGIHCTDQLFCVFKYFHIKTLEKDIWTSANPKNVSRQNPWDG